MCCTCLLCHILIFSNIRIRTDLYIKLRIRRMQMLINSIASLTVNEFSWICLNTLFADNAYDPDVNASVLRIDVEQSPDSATSITFTDNGCGLGPEKLHNMLRYACLKCIFAVLVLCFAAVCE